MGAGGGALPQEPGRQHPAVVEHQTVAGAQKGQNVPEMPVLPSTGLLVQHQQPGGIPRLQRLLRNQLLR